MARKIKVKVTSDDIDNGKGGVPDRCPIALAIKRDYPDIGDVYVDIDELDYGILLTSVPMPEVAGKFVESFDAWSEEDDEEKLKNMDEPMPFEFELELGL